MGALYETCNPCFPLRRAFLLACSWVSKPIPFYLSKYFELLCFIHSYDDLFNHVSYVPCFAHCSYPDVNYFENFHWKSQLFVNSSKLSTILRPRVKFAITNYDLLYVSLLCFLYSLQVELYNSELSSIMIYVFDECDASCPYYFIDSSLHKPEVMFIELSFSWGQAKPKLGGVDTSILHHYSMS